MDAHQITIQRWNLLFRKIRYPKISSLRSEANTYGQSLVGGKL